MKKRALEHEAAKIGRIARQTEVQQKYPALFYGCVLGRTEADCEGMGVDCMHRI